VFETHCTASSAVLRNSALTVANRRHSGLLRDIQAYFATFRLTSRHSGLLRDIQAFRLPTVDWYNQQMPYSTLLHKLSIVAALRGDLHFPPVYNADGRVDPPCPPGGPALARKMNMDSLQASSQGLASASCQRCW
jgi:hypothetical protein